MARTRARDTRDRGYPSQDAPPDGRRIKFQLSRRYVQGKKVRAWREKNPEKYAAHSEVYKALRSGKLVRPEGCQRCPRSGCRLVAHHHDYDRPLEVEWLCGSCHNKQTWRDLGLGYNPD